MSRTLGVMIGLVGAGALFSASGVARAEATTTETILFIRHAEKPPAGLGQLSCKGLNRALALAGRIVDGYGKVDAIFAPDPSEQKEDGAASFDYVRPLATVEPTAIRLGLPVHADFGFSNQEKLLEALNAPALRSATVLVAWEHHTLQKLVPALLTASGGDADAVPKWKSDDFDSIWKISIARGPDGRATATFAHDHQGLDGQPETCPH